jgi:hypothetical protein
LRGFWGAEEADLELELFETVVEIEDLSLEFGELELSEAVFWGVGVRDF